MQKNESICPSYSDQNCIYLQNLRSSIQLLSLNAKYLKNKLNKAYRNHHSAIRENEEGQDILILKKNIYVMITMMMMMMMMRVVK